MSATQLRSLRASLLKIQDVVELTTLSRATIYRRSNAGSFPKPAIKLGSARNARVLFDAGAIHKWLLSQRVRP